MKKILVVDDDEGVVEFLSSCLRVENYEVFTAYNGADGIRLAKEKKPDLVVLDLLMPGMHGFDVCETLRQDEALKDMKILVSSAKAYEVDKKAAERLGANQFLVKPFTAEVLIEAVGELLGKQ